MDIPIYFNYTESDIKNIEKEIIQKHNKWLSEIKDLYLDPTWNDTSRNSTKLTPVLNRELKLFFKPATLNNIIFIYFSGTHYDILIPKDYENKIQGDYLRLKSS